MTRKQLLVTFYLHFAICLKSFTKISTDTNKETKQTKLLQISAEILCWFVTFISTPRLRAAHAYLRHIFKPVPHTLSDTALSEQATSLADLTLTESNANIDLTWNWKRVKPKSPLNRFWYTHILWNCNVKILEGFVGSWRDAISRRRALESRFQVSLWGNLKTRFSSLTSGTCQPPVLIYSQ